MHFRGNYFLRCIAIFIQIYIIFIGFASCQNRVNPGLNLIERKVDDLKDYKKLLRTKNNVLTLFVKSESVVGVRRLLSVFGEVAEKVYGKATLAFVNCGSEEGKKTCKKLKVVAEPYVLKHFNNGDFNKDYDRAETADSIHRFLLDPTGDLPWEEEPSSKDVLHIPDSQYWMKLLRKEKLPILAMFYAPWCGYCKRLKPEYDQAATALKNTAILAALDVTRAENYDLQQHYNITGFPTLYYFADGKLKFLYGGEMNKDGLIKWIQNPVPGAEGKATVTEELPWADEKSDVVHLTDETFDGFVNENPSVLVMFYAPWCGHCKKMKPDYAAAAKKLKEQNSKGVLAAIEASTQKKIATQYDVKGFPTVKYFKDGKFAWDFNERSEDGLVSFMKDPQEPPPPPPPEQPWHEVDSDVIHLGVENFKPELKKRKHVLVMFYAPWCGHCKKAKPEYMMAASRFKDDPKVAFAAVDCTVHQDVCKVYEIQGFPTIKYFSYLKTVLDYVGGRDATDFVKFMSQQAEPSPPSLPEPEQKKEAEEKPPADEPDKSADADLNVWDTSVKMLTPENIDATFAAHDKTLIMFFAPWCRHCQEAKPSYVAAARKMTHRKNVVFAAVDCQIHAETICQDKRIAGYPSFVIYDSKGAYVDVHRGKDYVKTMSDYDDAAAQKKAQPPATQPDPAASAGLKPDAAKIEL